MAVTHGHQQNEGIPGKQIQALQVLSRVRPFRCRSSLGARHGVGRVGRHRPDLPEDLLQILSPAPAYLETQPVIGHWSSEAASVVRAILQSEGRHSMLAFAKSVDARAVTAASTPANINTPADLAAMEQN